jgi:hypothetical protein
MKTIVEYFKELAELLLGEHEHELQSPHFLRH